jgi:alkanesulfonate monooxygenase SsuD/methylene tetrahydromethanopterin reductase-like flavin-dependent oxidoreductase (luciferase family)
LSGSVANSRPIGLRFGLFLSQANKSLAQVYDEFQMAEDLGFDHAWLVDHLVDTDGPPDHPILEAWTLLAAIAARTRRIRLGVLVTSNTFRHPAVLLKEAVTVDHISGGRLTLGLGSGWHADEHRRYGIDLPEPAERVDRFAEAVELISLLMSQARTTFHGRHYRLDDAPLEPRPIQEPRIPILIAAHRPRMLRLAARFADQWDTFAEMPGTATDGVTSSIEQRIRALDEACEAIGRNPAEVRRSTWAPAAAVETDAAYEDFVARHRRLGFTDFSVVPPTTGAETALRRIAEGVIPGLRNPAARIEGA